MKTISIGSDFSETPIGRYPSDGGFSGERFRDEILVPLLQSNDKVEVVIDDVEGYGSSFLEEAFGGIVRRRAFDENQLKKNLVISLNDPDFEFYRKLIWRYIAEAQKSLE
jgi:hypothetical protein